MKNLLTLLSVVMLLAGAGGCGTVRNHFNKSSSPLLAQPVYSQCGPSCGSNYCSNGKCGAGGSCDCQSGTPVTYGYTGGGFDVSGGGIPTAPPASFGNEPMTLPTGSGTYGQ